MAGPEIAFLFQFGSLRDIVTANSSTLTLDRLKTLACDFINTKVSTSFKHITIIIIKMGKLIVFDTNYSDPKNSLTNFLWKS